MNKILALVAVAGAASVASAQLGQKNFQWNGAIPIPDLGQASTFIDVPGDGTTLDYLEVDLIASHTWQNDIIITLTSPWAATMILVSRTPSSLDNFGNPATGAPMLFNDAAALPYNLSPQINNPTGPYLAQGGSLNSFVNGHSKEGRWILTFADVVGADVGTIFQFSLHFNNVPTPGSLALLGLGGLVAARRRR